MTVERTESPQWIVPRWNAPANVRAAFTLRVGGVSEGPFASLNTGTHVGDAPAHVAENRRRIHAALDLPSEPLWLNQVHGTAVFDAQSGSGSAPPTADAAATRKPDTVVAIQVADCLPVLFAARDGSAVAAAHAGWRGLVAGVLENTVQSLELPGAELVAWLGPCIGPLQFEVGDEVRAAFVAQDARATDAFVRNDRNRWLCNLQLLARQRLVACGVLDVSADDACTVADPRRFFSYRRDGQCGRMVALIHR